MRRNCKNDALDDLAIFSVSPQLSTATIGGGTEPYLEPSAFYACGGEDKRARPETTQGNDMTSRRENIHTAYPISIREPQPLEPPPIFQNYGTEIKILGIYK